MAILLHASPVSAQTNPRQLAYRRAAGVELALSLVFASTGTALWLAPTEDETTRADDFGRGVGFAHVLLAPGLLLDGALDWASARRIAHDRPPLFAGVSLRSARWSVALSALVVALGGTLIVAGELSKSQDGSFATGMGTVYATYGSTGLIWAAWDLARFKRRRACHCEL